MVQSEDEGRQDLVRDSEINQRLPGKAGLEKAQAKFAGGGRGFVPKHPAEELEQVVVGDSRRQAIQASTQIGNGMIVLQLIQARFEKSSA